MKLNFKLHVGTNYTHLGVGHKIKFHKSIGSVCPGLRSWGNKIYTILDEDSSLNLFKMSRGDIWISKSVIDGRFAKLISKYRPL